MKKKGKDLPYSINIVCKLWTFVFQITAYLDLEITPRSLSKYKTSKFISLTTNLCLITVAKKTCTIEMTQNTPLYFLFSLFHLIFKYVWKEGEIYFYRPASFNFSNVEKYFNLPDLHTLRDMKKHNIIVFCKFCITHLFRIKKLANV